MKLLYLIGNGFDINVGLNTSYPEFLQYYLLQAPNAGLDKVGIRYVNRLKEDIKENINLWSDLERQYGKHMAKLGHMGSEVHSLGEEFDIINDDIRDHLSKYMGREEGRIVFSEESKKTFLADLVKPESFFRDFERNEVNGRKTNKWNNTSNVIDFITFNYTRTIEKLLVKMPQQSSGFDINGPTHVHGYHDSRMVMGVNDVSQIDNEEIRKLTYTTDALVKPNNNHVYGVSHTDRCISLIQNAQLICIYGLSFGDTDKNWWQKIIQELRNRSDLLVLTFWYKKDSPNYSNMGHKLQYEMNVVKDMFLAQGGVADSERQKFMDRVYVKINGSIFNFKIEEIGIFK